MIRVIISDTSCLIALDRIQKIHILQKTFNNVVTTPQVQQEFGRELPAWISIKEINDKQRFESLHQLLDVGEASAITLALETENCVLIIDERKGRKVAKELNLNIIGTLKVLLVAKQRGVIESVKEVIMELHNNNFRFKTDIVQEVLKLANEL